MATPPRSNASIVDSMRRARRSTSKLIRELSESTENVQTYSLGRPKVVVRDLQLDGVVFDGEVDLKH